MLMGNLEHNLLQKPTRDVMGWLRMNASVKSEKYRHPPKVPRNAYYTLPCRKKVRSRDTDYYSPSQFELDVEMKKRKPTE